MPSDVQPNDKQAEHIIWYERFAATQGGYVKNWASVIEGLSGEQVFADTVSSLIHGRSSCPEPR